MNGHSVRLLDFGVIRNELLDYAWSEDGKKRLQNDDFITDRRALEALRLPIGEFRLLLEGPEERPSLSLPDILDYAGLAEKTGSVLEARELAAVASYLRQAKTIKSYISKAGGVLRAEAEDLPDLSPLAARISKIVDAEGNIRENEIPSLTEIRRRIRAIRRDLDSLAAVYFGNPDYRGYWQADTASQKDGRMVLPLGTNFKGRIRGVVHEISSRGATAFFEPLDIFEKNNQFVEEENEYRREVFRLLRDLTRETGSRAGEIRFLAERIGYVDSIGARARYAHLHSCFTAEISSGDLLLRAARHPMLGKKAVPIDVEIKDGARILLITGPNTGGKTVALKTVGLLALMNQFGLDLPAAQGSRLPLFDDIYADIGDEQSIAESLSTFSAHVGNLASIARLCTSSSLVLLDELGSGTDPDQGAALAMSFLDRFLQKGPLALVTTHLGTLKNYAFTRPGASNASVDFDANLLTPTYRIIQGLPGASHALEIAERYGVPPDIIAAAKKYAGESETDSARLIRSLITQRQELELRGREIEEQREELRAKEAEFSEREAEVREKESVLRREGIREINAFLAESRKEMENLVRTIKEGRAEREDTLRIRSFVDKVGEQVVREQEKVRRSRPRGKSAAKGPLEPGMEVFVGASRRRGILERREKNGNWLVATGAVRVTVPEEDLLPAEPSRRGNEVVVSLGGADKGEPAKLELDLRGMRAEEALQTLEKQLDRAMMQGLPEFGVIHGKGEGILQNAVWDYLKAASAVAEFSFARPEAGGTGKTLVRLRG